MYSLRMKIYANSSSQTQIGETNENLCLNLQFTLDSKYVFALDSKYVCILSMYLDSKYVVGF
jgi:hypothetical protein